MHQFFLITRQTSVKTTNSIRSIRIWILTRPTKMILSFKIQMFLNLLPAILFNALNNKANRNLEFLNKVNLILVKVKKHLPLSHYKYPKFSNRPSQTWKWNIESKPLPLPSTSICNETMSTTTNWQDTDLYPLIMALNLSSSKRNQMCRRHQQR